MSAALFSPALIIKKKRDGETLSSREIEEFIRGITDGTVADYQASAFLMAVFFQGMNLEETVALTRAMLESGERYSLSDVKGAKVDKHSTGGVGDKVSLILAPLAAACGVKVPMMSGRGLGHSGGTLDKLESIPGFDVHIPIEKFKSVIHQVGCAMIGQSQKIAPADRKLYSLRDVTGTIECVPLITGSILSKKLAEGTNGLLLDVKVGNGAFMKKPHQAKMLTKTLIQVAKKMGLKCRALITNMDQPLGYSAGNAIEVLECVQILRNEKRDTLSSTDLRELTLLQCAHMIVMAGVKKSLGDAKKLATEKLRDGSAYQKFVDLCEAQGGNLEKLLASFNSADGTDFHSTLYPTVRKKWVAKRSGTITSIQTENIGNILVEMGGGRKQVTDRIHPGAGLVFHRKLGAKVKEGDLIVDAYIPTELAQNASRMQALESWFHESIRIERVRKPIPSLVSATLT